MALVTILDENKTLGESKAIAAYLETCGVNYERWEPAHPVAADAPAEEILRAYASEIEELKVRGGYFTPEVVAFGPDKPSRPGEAGQLNRANNDYAEHVRVDTLA